MRRYALIPVAMTSASCASRSAWSGSPSAIATPARVHRAVRQIEAGRRRNSLFGPPAGSGQIRASKCGPAVVLAPQRCGQGHRAQVRPGRRRRILRRSQHRPRLELRQSARRGRRRP